MNTTPTRHLPGIVLGLALLAVFGTLTWMLWDLGTWWLIASIPTAFLATLGTYGIVSDAQQVPRDGRGRRLP